MASANHTFQYTVDPKLLEVLESAGATRQQLTLTEILFFLRLYIGQKALYDPSSPTRILCPNDPLEKAFGVSAFNLLEIPTYLRPILSKPQTIETNDLLHTEHFEKSSVAEKRKLHSEGTAAKRQCGASELGSPMYLEIPGSPEYDSAPESVLSIQGYETALAKDSSDDLWFLETDDEEDLATDLEFEVEYEVVSDKSDDEEERICSDTEAEVVDVVGAAILLCHTDSDVEFWADYSDNEIDSNDSSDSDPEMTEGDKWKCRLCSAMNRPLSRFCLKCWQLRSDWLSDRRHPRRHPRRLQRTISAPNNRTAHQRASPMRRRKTSRSLIDFAVAEDLVGEKSPPQEDRENVTDDHPSCSAKSADPHLELEIGSQSSGCPSEFDELCNPFILPAEPLTPPSEPASPPSELATLPATPASPSVSHSVLLPAPSVSYSAPSPAPSTSSTESQTHEPPHGAITNFGLCVICMVRPKNASLVHGKTGHQVCCFGCGNKLWERNGQCPVCRRTIQKVIQNFIV